MEQIDSSQVHLWLTRLGEIDAARHAEFQSLLNEEELKRLARFRFGRDRFRFLVTRAMVRTVLSRYSQVAPRDWRFSVNPYGKPSIAAPYAGTSWIQFNVSHTNGLVAIAVARKRAIGVDVEDIRAREVDIEIADRYFAPEEVAALRALPPEAQRLRFFEYWTLKEAYIKARGVGLSIPLDRFAFSLDDPSRIRCRIDATLQDSAERWTFWRWSLAGDVLAALCAEEGRGARPTCTPPRYWR